jgi:hypothetical protein
LVVTSQRRVAAGLQRRLLDGRKQGRADAAAGWGGVEAEQLGVVPA